MFTHLRPVLRFCQGCLEIELLIDLFIEEIGIIGIAGHMWRPLFRAQCPLLGCFREKYGPFRRGYQLIGAVGRDFTANISK